MTSSMQYLGVLQGYALPRIIKQVLSSREYKEICRKGEWCSEVHLWEFRGRTRLCSWETKFVRLQERNPCIWGRRNLGLVVENDPWRRLVLSHCRGRYVWQDIVAGSFRPWILKLASLEMTISPVEKQGDLRLEMNRCTDLLKPGAGGVQSYISTMSFSIVASLHWIL